MPDFLSYSTIVFLAILYGRTAFCGPFLLVVARLPATLAHELAHLLVALVTGAGVQSFTVWPRRSVDGGWVLGSVRCRRVGRWNAFPLGMAPILVCLPAAWLVYQAGTVVGYAGSFVLLAASVPSDQDVRVAFSSFLGAFVWFVVCAGWVWFWVARPVSAG